MTHDAYARDLPENRDWMEKASCAQVGGDMWYAEEGQPLHIKRAKAVCAECPVRMQCLDYAMRHEAANERTTVRYGIFGGLTPHQRNQLAKKVAM